MNDQLQHILTMNLGSKLKQVFEFKDALHLLIVKALCVMLLVF